MVKTETATSTHFRGTSIQTKTKRSRGSVSRKSRQRSASKEKSKRKFRRSRQKKASKKASKASLDMRISDLQKVAKTMGIQFGGLSKTRLVNRINNYLVEK